MCVSVASPLWFDRRMGDGYAKGIRTERRLDVFIRNNQIHKYYFSNILWVKTFHTPQRQRQKPSVSSLSSLREKKAPPRETFFLHFLLQLVKQKKKTVLYTFLFPFSYSHHWVCTVSSSFRSLCPPIDRLLGLFALLLRLLISPSSTSGVICSQKLKCRASMSRYSTDTNARISVAFCTNAMIWLKMTIYMKIILKLYRSRPDEGRSSLSL